MEHGLKPVGPVTGFDGRVIPIRRASHATAGSFSTPAELPADVRADLDVAARVIEQLSAQQVNLHFEVDHGSGTVHVQVLAQDGRVLREIPPKSLFDTLCGRGLLIDQHG